MMSKIMVVILLSAIFFYSIPVSFAFYLVVCCISVVAVALRFSLRKSQELLSNIMVLATGTFAGFGLVKWLQGASLSGIDSRETMLLAVYIVLFVCIVAGALDLEAWSRTEGEEEYPELFAARKYDLERILNYLRDVSIVGVNGPWGSGKSLLMYHLTRATEVREQYEVIQIDLLACNLDKIEATLLDEFDKVLNRKHIFSRHSRRLQRMLEEKGAMKHIQELLFADSTAMAVSFQGIKRDIANLDKKILILYEDIDRISDGETIRKIFALSEKLASERIKVIYQFDQNILDGMEPKLERDYLEKYIPHIVNVTELGFVDILRSVWPEMKMDEFGLGIREVERLDGQGMYDFHLQRILGHSVDVEIRNQCVSVRRMKVFLTEVRTAFRENVQFYESEFSRRVVLVFFYLRHFGYAWYRKLNFYESPMETFRLRNGGDEFTVSQMFALYAQYEEDPGKGFSPETIKMILQNQENAENYTILRLFGYGFTVKSFRDKRDFYEISEQEISEISKNDKIDHLIWNLLGNGRSEFTDAEHAMEKLVADVLSRDEEEWEERWKVYSNDLFYHQNMRKDNTQIFRFGEDSFGVLAQIFRVHNATKDDWLKLIRLCQKVKKERDLTVERIVMFGHLDVHKKRVFLKAVEWFLELQVSGNMNDEHCYLHFLQQYMIAMWIHGYARSYNRWQLEVGSCVEDGKAIIMDVLESVLRQMKREKELFIVEEIREEMGLMIRFVERNLELINCQIRKKRHEIKWETKIRESEKNTEEMNRLKEIKEVNSELFAGAVSESYRDGKIDVREVWQLMQYTKKSKGE